MAEDLVNKKRPLIVKRKKVVGGEGHHGGAWKVAYADFVTAMMAFFLLMWLLNATTEDQRKGLADYFDSQVPIARMSGGGRDIFSGDSMTAAEDLAESGGGVTQNSDGTASGRGEMDDDREGEARVPDPAAVASEPGAVAEAQAFTEVEDVLASLSGESATADAVLSHVRTRQTPDGLVIDIFDREGAPLFTRGSAEPTPMLRALVDVVASVAALTTNAVSIAGHTDATPFDVGGEDGNWRLSSERAEATRRLLVGAGLEAERIAEVAGRAATEPMVDDPRDPRNRRVAITLLRKVRR